jgi:nucleotide-binding universal stress UspA family protein
MATMTRGADALPDLRQPFARVLVGVDSSPESVEAARQAAVLVDPLGSLTLLSAWSILPSDAGISDEAEAALRQGWADEALAKVTDALGRQVAAQVTVRRGAAWRELITEAEAIAATLIVVGSHGRSRLRGIAAGSTTTEVVHKAPCSVLVARPAGGDFPRRIVVGVDGSPESAVAYAVGAELAERFAATLWPVVAHGGVGVDKSAVARVVGPRHEDLPDEPVLALVAASAEADLVVVGSRGLRGLKSLGSVSERVAHRARCSTLVLGMSSAYGR